MVVAGVSGSPLTRSFALVAHLNRSCNGAFEPQARTTVQISAVVDGHDHVRHALPTRAHVPSTWRQDASTLSATLPLTRRPRRHVRAG